MESGKRRVEIAHVVIESRDGERSEFRTEHLRKSFDERLWLADFLVGAYFASVLHDEPEPWDIITAAHVVDVITDPRIARNPGSRRPAGGPGLTSGRVNRPTSSNPDITRTQDPHPTGNP
ncbi:hypothetical protein NLX83_06815 [Allokutzneria sp. A3M-2-11 16]|uniref:hypothetical protein n=1 Tax=Allokutzneria sp. A3M-2-11 16 TaxID=2962043 RepID=UPI0020B7BC70|nr:hypothetical protein [Allokutzneria sp. A3M-2-11 16]MCP3798963.1 hypothetical protein [Allokutzneria sp. A3M-2-11 16]